MLMRVLVATDLSDAADVALREGAAMTSKPEDALAVVHALPPLPLLKMWLPQFADDRAAIAARAADAVTERTRRVLGDRAPEVFVENEVDYAAIIERAEDWKADVVAVGSHGLSGLAGFVGSVGERVLRHAPCSVLVSRPGPRGPVLAATDSSDPSFHAITAAASEARRRGAQLEVVHALGLLDVEALYLVELGTPSVQPAPGVFGAAASELSRCVARLHVDATCKVLERPAAAAIVREAEAIDAQLIVASARGRSELSVVPLGRVAEKVARTARCSVLVVRPGAVG